MPAAKLADEALGQNSYDVGNKKESCRVGSHFAFDLVTFAFPAYVPHFMHFPFVQV